MVGDYILVSTFPNMLAIFINTYTGPLVLLICKLNENTITKCYDATIDYCFEWRKISKKLTE